MKQVCTHPDVIGIGEQPEAEVHDCFPVVWNFWLEACVL